MISVIICSVKPPLLIALKRNIEESIGVPYEIIALDNRNSNKGICQVYNEAGQLAKYEVLCFIHEDVVLHTKGWGMGLIELLKDQSIGLVGISGSVYKSKYPAAWSACDSSLYRTHSIQHFLNQPAPVVIDINPMKVSSSEVAVADGVFLSTTKKIFSEFKFDQNTLNAFHGYDLDYSLTIGTRYKVVVSYRILLEHLSEGTFNAGWLKDSFIVHRKWGKQLPKTVIPMEKTVKEREDCIACQSVLNVIISNQAGRMAALKYWSLLVTRFFKYNGMKYTKATLKYLSSTGS